MNNSLLSLAQSVKLKTRKVEPTVPHSVLEPILKEIAGGVAVGVIVAKWVIELDHKYTNNRLLIAVRKARKDRK